MNKKSCLNFLATVTLFSVCVAVQAKPPTCAEPQGKWRNERGSVLHIQHYDSASGAISGVYVSASGTLGSHPMVGWINTAPKSAEPGKVNHAEVVTFAVHWANGGLSAWTGTCNIRAQFAGHEQISALWHTTRANTSFDWDHTLTGFDHLDPID